MSCYSASPSHLGRMNHVHPAPVKMPHSSPKVTLRQPPPESTTPMALNSGQKTIPPTGNTIRPIHHGPRGRGRPLFPLIPTACQSGGRGEQ